MSYKKKKFKITRKVKAFKFLMDNFDLNMKEAQRWIDKGRILIEDQPLIQKSAYLYGEFDVIYFQTCTRNLLPIVETRDFAIYDKPSGVLIHPTSKMTDYSLTHEVKHRFGKDANITHRLDKETSGLVLVSKNKKCEKDLKNLFEQRLVKKTYLCYVKGNIKKSFIVDQPILKNRSFEEIKLKVKIDPNGKSSLTAFKPLRYDPTNNTTLLQATPHTGRQHQIRVHLFHVGFPIIGDPIYGVDTKIADDYLNKNLSKQMRKKLTGSHRLMLHANSIEFFYKNRYKIVSKEKFIF